MTEALSRFKEEGQGKLEKEQMNHNLKPMLATLTKERFSDEGWIYERKLDGERCLVFREGNRIRLVSRNQKELNRQYPEIEEAFKEQEGNFIVDGEIVAFEKNKTSFSRLQKRMHRKEPDMSVKVHFYAFDILHYRGYNLRGLPLRTRKSILRQALKFSSGILRYTTHRNKEGEKYLQEACRKKWEGLIAKDADSNYVSTRSKKWLKFKCENNQELVIAGYTDPEGSRKHFGALLVGFYEDSKLVYAGKVGTGYDDETLEMLYGKMKKLKTGKPPFEKGNVKVKNVHWVKPELVGQFQFTEWTGDNKLRHPSFLGLRDDKKPEEVKKEEI